MSCATCGSRRKTIGRFPDEAKWCPKCGTIEGYNWLLVPERAEAEFQERQLDIAAMKANTHTRRQPKGQPQ
jgi:hypothetical protein